MPCYDIYNGDTDEFSEVFMSYSSLQQHLEENPNLVLVPSAPMLVSGIAGVTYKNDGGFKEMMGRIADGNPYSPLAEEYGSKGIQDSKKREAVRNELKRRAKR